MKRYRTTNPGDDAQGEEAELRIFGVNQRVAAEKLPAGLCAEAVNVRMRDGTPATRLGTVRPGWLNVTRAGVDAVVRGVGQFYGVGSFKDPNGFEWTLTAADGGIFRHKPHNGRTALALPASVKVLSDCSFCQGFNVVYCFRGKFLQPLVMSSVDTGFADLVARWSASTVYQAGVVTTGAVAAEVAYGPFQGMTSLTSAGDVATCVTTLEHGYVTGADVVIRGAVETGYNGRWNITVVDASTFTFQFAGASATPATGTPKVSNMGLYWKARGSVITLSAGEMTSSGSVVTVHHTAHGFTTGQYVTVLGAAQAQYNVTEALVTVTDADHFTYPFVAGAATPATGTITVRTSVVLAGQSPDTNPEAWQQLYNVLPNCDDGIFVNNRILAATSYTPGNDGYDSTSVYTKKDFVVALDIGDLVHFDFVNEFRINQGGDDEIVQLIKAPAGAVNASGVSTDAVVVVKGKSWHVLTGVSGDLSQVALDSHMDGYGGCALRAGVVAGANVIFPSSARGVVALRQMESGQARSVSVPFSNDVPGWIGRILWTLGTKARCAYWDDKLYVAVPLDDGKAEVGVDLIAAAGAPNDDGVTITLTVPGFVVGQRYRFTPGNAQTLSTELTFADEVRLVGAGQVISGGEFVAQQESYYLVAAEGTALPVTATVRRLVRGCNAVLVYDFRVPHVNAVEDGASPYVYETGGWQSVDTGRALCVKEWFTATYNGKDRLFFIGEDGWANLVEESDAGDQVESGASASGLAWEEVEVDWTSRGFVFDGMGQKKWKWLELVLGVWNAVFDVHKGTGAVGSDGLVVEGKQFSRTQYLKPAGRADYVAGNGNGDFLTGGRGDYSVPLSVGVDISSGTVSAGVMQEVAVRASVRTLAGRYGQFRVVNRQGRIQVKGIAPSAGEGTRRGGIII
jgi:hypothetical protein